DPRNTLASRLSPSKAGHCSAPSPGPRTRQARARSLRQMKDAAIVIWTCISPCCPTAPKDDAPPVYDKQFIGKGGRQSSAFLSRSLSAPSFMLRRRKARRGIVGYLIAGFTYPCSSTFFGSGRTLR